MILLCLANIMNDISDLQYDEVNFGCDLNIELDNGFRFICVYR